MIIHLNGRAGVGKLTVAQILAKELGARVIDNHAVINLVRTLTDRRTPEYFAMISKTMDLVLTEISLRPKSDYFIFTNWLSAKHDEDRKRLDKIAEISDKRGIPFLQILIDCSLEENKRRIISESRISLKKLTDPNILEEYYITGDIYHPAHPNALMIDTTDKEPVDVVNIIKERIAAIQNN